MKYFTPERYLALQNPDGAAMDVADANWEQAVDHYEATLQAIGPELPGSVRQMLDGFYLHDAEVLSMGQRDDTFVIALQLDVPPHDLLTIAYALAAAPSINREALPPQFRSARPHWLYDEVELVQDGSQNRYLHSILLSNGWEIQLPFLDVQLTTAEPMFPLRQSQPPLPIGPQSSQPA
jgi:hypothetical protein